MAGEFQPLRLAAAQCGNGLAEFHVSEPDATQRLQRAQYFGMRGEEFAGFVRCHVQNVRDGFPLDFDFQDFRAVPLSIAIGAAQVDIAEKLHFHVLEAVSPAGGTASLAGIETERAGGITAFLCERFGGEKFADCVERADVTRGVRARGAANGRLVHHHHVLDLLVAGDGAVTTGGFVGFVFQFTQRVVENVLDQGGFSRTADAGNADEPI